MTTVALMSEQADDRLVPRLPTDWWATADVLRYLESVGATITRSTWTTYVTRKQAPAAERVIGGSPVWRPATIRAWQSQRRGQGWRGARNTAT